MKFITKYHRAIQLAANIALILACALWLAGCSIATWIADANQIIPIAASMAAAILQLIGALGGTAISAAAMDTLNKVMTDIEGGLKSISDMVAEYQANPSTTLLAQIEEGTKAVIDNVGNFLANTGIEDAATQKKITAILQLILTEVTSFQSLLPVLKANPGDKFEIIVPMSTKQAKAAFNAILSEPSGNPAVDAALAKIHRM